MQKKVESKLNALYPKENNLSFLIMHSLSINKI